MSLEQRTKKELVDLIHQLQDKVKEMKPVEKQLTAQLDELKAPAIGLHKDEKGVYHLIFIKYDIDKKAAAIENVTSLESTDPAIGLYNLNKYVSETIVRKARGGKYDK